MVNSYVKSHTYCMKMCSSTTPHTQLAFQVMSQSVYHGMCHIIGTPEDVSCRRDMVDISEFLNNQLHTSDEGKEMQSGSHREGFRFHTSDIDEMIIIPRHHVIWDMSQFGLYNTDRHKLILCNSSESPPGFTLLRLLPSENTYTIVYQAEFCEWKNGELYISSSKFREITCSLIRPNSTMHGPCGSELVGRTMYDYANCFVSDLWPPTASSWIERCHVWPPQHVSSDIVRNGCHFVAIGHKLGNHEDIEWRISFSQAENKLIYSMNHTQFSTYGLLKLFLNEVINDGLSDEEKLLCSYHMKTAIFWAIQQNMLTQWCPENMMAGFWICFKIVLKWVYNGVCPNFFIPQNNMFLSRIYGEDQRNLFRRLYELYEKGSSLLLHISPIRDYILNHLIYIGCIVSYDCDLGSELTFDDKLYSEIDRSDSLTTHNLQDCAKALLTIEQLICSPLTSYMIILLQKVSATVLRSTAFILHNQYIDKSGNKNTYIRDKKSLHLLRLSMKFGYVSDMLYIAMFYYKTFRYKEALSIIDISKVKMSQPYVLFRGNGQRLAYIEAVGGQPWSTKMKQAIASHLRLDNNICYITELLLEQKSGNRSNRSWILISPFILANMLEFLICRHNDTSKAQAALDNITALIQHSEQGFVAKDTMDISWEILGICQEIKGNIQAARFSFQQSLKQYPIFEIQLATRERIQNLYDQEKH
eukprot:XP_019919909.1 PREDICTED: uncharacterized protein LOC105320880 [Crassostrea gigas]